MKPLLLLTGLLLASGPAAAQTPLMPSLAHPPAAMPTAPAAPDTLAAIHRLFAAKRRKNRRFLAGTIAVNMVGGVRIGSASSNWEGMGQAGQGIAVIVLVGLPTLVAEVFTALDYNKASERQAVEDLQAHRLPYHLKRKLKAKYFQ